MSSSKPVSARLESVVRFEAFGDKSCRMLPVEESITDAFLLATRSAVAVHICLVAGNYISGALWGKAGSWKKL